MRLWPVCVLGLVASLSPLQTLVAQPNDNFQQFPTNPFHGDSFQYPAFGSTFMDYSINSSEWNYLHSGIDVYAPAGSWVYAPIIEGQTYSVIDVSPTQLFVMPGRLTGYGPSTFTWDPADPPRTQGGLFPVLSMAHISHPYYQGYVFSSSNQLQGAVTSDVQLHMSIAGVASATDPRPELLVNANWYNPTDHICWDAKQSYNQFNWMYDTWPPVFQNSPDGLDYAIRESLFLSEVPPYVELEVYVEDTNDSAHNNPYWSSEFGTPEWYTGIRSLDVYADGRLLDEDQPIGWGSFNFSQLVARPGADSAVAAADQYYHGAPPSNGNLPVPLTHFFRWYFASLPNAPIYRAIAKDYVGNSAEERLSGGTILHGGGSPIVSFSGAALEPSVVTLDWVLDAALLPKACRLLRSSGRGAVETIIAEFGHLPASGASNVGEASALIRIRYRDVVGPTPWKELRYRLEVQTMGDDTFHQSVIVRNSAWRPGQLVVWPNPARSGFVTVSYAPAEEAFAGSVSIYDVAGRLVRVLGEEHEVGGVQTFVWDGRGTEGHRVAAGVYFVRLESAQSPRVQKVVIAR